VIARFEDAEQWNAWLADNHAASPGIWLNLAKKSSQRASLTYAEAVEVALSWGWIDGQKKSRDESSWLQRFTPRGARSLWSKINRQKAEALIASRRMKPPGLAAVVRAKQDGRWDAAYDSPRTAAMPADLQARLDRSAKARASFATLDGRNRYAILWRLQTAKRPETRARRLDAFIAMLEKGDKLYP
jgi:uncharacterized protein YdeI (YjbR/CyaY-like superfamily)